MRLSWSSGLKSHLNEIGVFVAHDSIEAELLALDQARFVAMVNNDFGKLNELLDDDLVWTHASASSDGKEGFLERLRSGSTRYIEIERSGEQVRVFGESAIVTGIASMRAIVGGTDRALRNRYVNVWICKAGIWKMVQWQSTAVPASNQ